jgi:Flp pilus assembly protein TadG
LTRRSTALVPVPATRPSVCNDEQGTGLVSTILGVWMFLLFLLLGAQVLIYLYLASVLTVTAFDAARVVSGAAAGSNRAQAQAQAEADALEDLGSFAGQVAPFDWSGTTADDVILTVSADTPNLLPGAVADLIGMDTLERTVRLRIEVFR